MTGEFPAQKASMVSIWWRHQVTTKCLPLALTWNPMVTSGFPSQNAENIFMVFCTNYLNHISWSDLFTHNTLKVHLMIPADRGWGWQSWPGVVLCAGRERKLCCQTMGEFHGNTVEWVVLQAWLGRDRVILQYHGCWCPGSLRRQIISSRDIGCVK